MTKPSVDLRAQKDVTGGLLFGLLGVLAFSFSLPMTRLATRELDPTFVGLGRALLAAVLSICLLAFKRQPIPARNQWLGLSLVTVGVVIGFPLASSWAVRFVPSAHAAVINALLPLTTAIGGAIANRQRPSALFWLAACGGSATVFGYLFITNGITIEAGDALMLIAVAIATLGYVAGGNMSRVIGSWQTICWANVIAAPFLVIPVWSRVAMFGIQASTTSWGAFLYLGCISMFLGFFAWYRGLALGGIARVSQVQLVQAFLTVLWAALLLGESISPLMIAAASLVVILIFVARRAPIYETQNVHTKAQPN